MVNHHRIKMNISNYEFIDQEPPTILSHINTPFFVTADLHFCHKNILQYEPIRQTIAQNVDDMNDVLFNNWNSIVGIDDVVLLLGDVCLGKAWEIGYWCGRLNGHKILVIGNHDRRKTVTFWKQFFQEVYKTPVKIGRGIYSHEPVSKKYMQQHGATYNTHGHTHSGYIDEVEYDCVSTEQSNFYPIQVTSNI